MHPPMTSSRLAKGTPAPARIKALVLALRELGAGARQTSNRGGAAVRPRGAY